VDEVTCDIEEALAAHWSHLGRWPPGALVDEAGMLRYETPIAHLPYNGVIRTLIEDPDPDRMIAAVVDSFGRREVPFLGGITRRASLPTSADAWWRMD
jgi:hypothetical protein